MNTVREPEPPLVDLERPSVARVYDYYLGGTANWAIDREFAKRVLAVFPMLRPIALANRLFLSRAVRYLVRAGVRQFVDIGSGVPTMSNTHQVAEELCTGCRVVYVDNEPVAVAHSQMLLEQNGSRARHAAIEADLRDPDELWWRVGRTGVVDLDRPVALLIIAVLHVQQPGPDGADVGPDAVARFRELLCPASYLAVSHLTAEGVPAALADNLVRMKQLYDARSSPVAWRTHDEIRALLGDFELVEPGLTWTTEWHPDESGPDAPAIGFAGPSESAIWVGVGRKPGVAEPPAATSKDGAPAPGQGPG